MWGEMIDVDKALLQHIASPVRVFSARDSLLYGYCSTDRYRNLCAKKQSKFKSIHNYFFLFSFIILLCNCKASVCYATILPLSIPKLVRCGTCNSVAMRATSSPTPLPCRVPPTPLPCVVPQTLLPCGVPPTPLPLRGTSYPQSTYISKASNSKYVSVLWIRNSSFSGPWFYLFIFILFGTQHLLLFQSFRHCWNLNSLFFDEQINLHSRYRQLSELPALSLRSYNRIDQADFFVGLAVEKLCSLPNTVLVLYIRQVVVQIVLWIRGSLPNKALSKE